MSYLQFLSGHQIQTGRAAANAESFTAARNTDAAVQRWWKTAGAGTGAVRLIKRLLPVGA